MKISGSFLTIQDDENKITKLNEVTDYMHFDVMDGHFTARPTLPFSEIIQKTDNRHLFEYSLISFVNHNYKIDKISLDLTNDDLENVTSEYEEKFIKLGLPIYMVEVYKDWHVK